MFIYLFILVLTLLVISYTKKCLHFKKLGLDGPLPVPYIGLSFDHYFLDTRKTNLIRRKRYGKTYGFFFGNIPVIVSGDPEIAKIVTQKEAQNFTDTQIVKLNIKYFKDTFLTKKGSEWKNGRALVSPVFTTKRIKDIFPQIKKAANPLFENIEALIKQGKQDEIEIKGLLKGFSLDVVAKFVFAMELNSARDKDHPFVKAVKKITSFELNWKLTLASFLPPQMLEYLDIEFLDVPSMDFIANLTKYLIKERSENTETKYNDFLDLMLQSIKQKNLEVKDEAIIGVAILFFFAGLETVGTTICNVLYSLILNPECQTKLYDELIDLFPNKELEYEDLNKSSYLEAVIKESQRMYPVLTMLFRIADDPIEIKGLKIEKNGVVGVDIMSLHNSPDYWTEPEKFNPDRFLEKDSRFDFDNVVDSDSSPLLFAPFGSGPRSCIATRYALTQVKYTIAKIILNYDVYRTEKTVVPIKYMPNPQQLMYKTMYVGLRKREN